MNPQEECNELKLRLANAKVVALRCQKERDEKNDCEAMYWVGVIMLKIEEEARKGKSILCFTPTQRSEKITCWGFCKQYEIRHVNVHVMNKIRDRLNDIGLVVTYYSCDLWIRWLPEREPL